MDIEFSFREDGQVDVGYPNGPSIFIDALNHCITSLPHRGEQCIGPSTYWIDCALRGLQKAIESKDRTPFARGNLTELSWIKDEIRARYDYDLGRGPFESVSTDEFRTILSEWRSRILTSATQCTAALPETYRRNPASPHHA